MTTRFAELWWAGRLSLWFCGLPVRLRGASLPAFLHRFTQVPHAQPYGPPLALERAVRIALRVCRLWCFREPLFPRACVRQALALTHVLMQLGYPVVVHFGVRKAGEELQGHSWVTLHGRPLAERNGLDTFALVYSYPCTSLSAQDIGTQSCQGGPYGSEPATPTTS